MGKSYAQGAKRYGVPRPEDKLKAQTAKAAIAPRMGQKTRSPYKRLLSQRSQYGIVANNYNVGRTRRMG